MNTLLYFQERNRKLQAEHDAVMKENASLKAENDAVLKENNSLKA